ncbi:MAG: hypothetical protein VKK04_00065 [Synechococcales bacterium]|nr:hypothetical protein [Synechococcales bacterium]
MEILSTLLFVFISVLSQPAADLVLDDFNTKNPGCDPTIHVCP